MTWDRRHLLQLEGLGRDDLLAIIDHAERLRESALGRADRSETLKHRTIANLFFEDSTRTRSSFTIAARRLGADTIDLTSSGSSVSKGETIVDTALNLRAMGVHGFVIRCSASGGAHLLAQAVGEGLPVINAGDGRHEHPTQGLLDIMTLRQNLGPDLTGRTVGIVGDISNSRVARSALHGLTTLGANVVLCGPPTLAPKSFESIANGPGKVSVTHDLDGMIPTLDAIMMLRVQFERAGGGPALIAGDYHGLYGLTAERAARLRKHAIVMHPGPVNRGLELDSEVMDAAPPHPNGRSVIMQQVGNGVAVRMAVLAMTIGR